MYLMPKEGKSRKNAGRKLPAKEWDPNEKGGALWYKTKGVVKVTTQDMLAGNPIESVMTMEDEK